MLTRDFHLCHLEVPKTVRRIVAGGPPLLDNSARPHIGVVAIAKRTLSAERTLAHGIGSFDVRGMAVPLLDCRDCVPVGLLEDARIKRDVAAGEAVRFDDVELPPSLALEAWRTIETQVAEDAALT